MIQLKYYITLFFLFNYTLYSQVTVTSNNLKVDNNLVSNNTIVFNSSPSVNISLDIKMETTDGSTNTTFGNLFLYYKQNTNDNDPTQIAFQSITFVNNYPKTNYINNTFFTSITLFKTNFLSNGGTLYAEYKANDKKAYKSQVINIIGGGYTTMPPPPNNKRKQILSNLIGSDQIIASGEIPKPFTYYIPYYRNSDNLPGRHGSASLNSPNPNIDLTIFKWQIKTHSTNWTDIPGETAAGYSPNKAIYENSSYRRVAFYEGGEYDFSNTIFIIINDQSFQNTICCDQILTSSSSGTEVIVGNAPNLNNFTYKWQQCSSPNDINKNWADMLFANDQNFPISYPQPSTGRGNETIAYRRLIKQNGNVISISNTANITLFRSNTSTGPTRNDGTTPTRRSQSLMSIAEPDDNNMIIYPNPFINSFSIEGPINLGEIKLYDSFGQVLNVNKTQSSKDKIEINTTNLRSGAYILKIDNTSFSKTLIKN
jgi:hypothetical protein